MNGPLLIVADNAAIARRATHWAAEFAAAGRLYRVRLAGALGARDLEGVVAEGRSLAAAAVLAAGGPATRALAAAAAAALGLPLVQDEAEAGGGG